MVYDRQLGGRQGLTRHRDAVPHQQGGAGTSHRPRTPCCAIGTPSRNGLARQRVRQVCPDKGDQRNCGSRRRTRSCNPTSSNVGLVHQRDRKWGGLTFRQASNRERCIRRHAKRGGQAGSVQRRFGVEGRRERRDGASSLPADLLAWRGVGMQRLRD